MKKILITIIFLLSGIFIFPQAVAAATIYLNSSSGNDTTGNGSSGSPYKTFHKGYTTASAGDTLNLTGTFDWTNSDETGDSAGTGYTLGKNLTIQGQGADATFIQAASSANTADRGVFTVSSGVTITIKNITVRYGVSTATETAGGITNSGTLNIYNSKILYNKYNSSNNYGAGGITLKHSANGTLNIATSTVAYNTFNGKYYGSGGVYSGQSNTINITSSTFHDNEAISTNPTDFAYSYAEPSGALGVFRFVTTSIINSTFTSNTTNSYSGALQVYYPNSFKITNSTIVNNNADAGAGGILFESVTDGYNLHMKNTILANNTGNGSSNDFYVVSGSAGRITDNGYNIVEYSTNKTWSATGDITGNQASLNIASSLADNNATNGVQTLALSSGSVAIDAGNSTANSSIAILDIDQRGGGRNGTVDIGAYEYNASGLVVTYTLTYTAGANGSISGTSPQTVNEGSNGSAVTAAADTGYSFSSWSDSSTQNPRTDTNVSANVSVTASFSINQYTVTFDSQGGSSVDSITQNYNTSVTVPAGPSKTGYTFDSWNTAADGSGTAYNPGDTFSMPVSGRTLYAQWNINQHTLSYSAGQGGSLSGSTSQTINYGSNGSAVTAVPDAGYTFLQWSDGSTQNPRSDLTITGDLSVQAEFKKIGGAAPAPPPAIGLGLGLNVTHIPMNQTGAIGAIGNQGISILSYINSSASFSSVVSTTYNNQNHTLKIDDLDLISRKVTVTFQSEPVTVSLSLKETAEVDLDQDGINDVQVTFADLVVNRVEITIKPLLDLTANNYEGALIKYSFSPKVYLIKDGKKSWIVDEDTFNYYSYDWKKVAAINDNINFEDGPDVVKPGQKQSYQFTRDLSLGLVGEDVKALQQYLNNHGFLVAALGPGSKGQEVEIFGPLTKAALIKLQQAYNLPSFGYFGPLTRQLVNAD